MAGEGELDVGDKRLYYLVSDNDELNIPGNTASNFVTQLPEALLNPKRLPLMVKLREVVVPNYMKDGTDQPPGGLVRVHLAELKSQTENRKYSQVLATFVFPWRFFTDKRSGKHYQFMPPHAAQLELRFTEVRRFRVRLTDVYDNDIEFEEGVKTVIVMEVTTRTEKSQFTIMCTSMHKKTYPQNTLTRFRSPLPEEIHLRGYEVALLQTMFPKTLRHKDKYARLRINDQVKWFKVDETMTEAHFAVMVRGVIWDAGLSDELIFDKDPDDDRVEKFMFRRIFVQNQKPRCILAFDTDFARLVSRPGGMHEMRDTYLEPLDKVELGKYCVGNVAPDSFGILSCDILEANVLGNTHGHALSIVPFMRKPLAGHNQMLGVGIYEPENLIFHPVADKPFSTIEFSVTDTRMVEEQYTSDDVDGDDMMIVTLVFRRK